MEVKTETRTRVTLTMNEEEATWLKGLMQNPHLSEGVDEDEKSYDIRTNFWNILGKAGI